jgi:ribosomal-protein-alanine N-acetyltransferase
LEGTFGILTIRSMEARDVPAVMSIQSACPEIAQWTVRDYAHVAEGDMAGWVAGEEELAGFIVARRVASDLEILNFAVRTAARRRGIGAALLRGARDWGLTFSAERVFLEVRISNLAAIRFYERGGFEVTGRRPRYYSEPIEDALVLTASLRPG